MLIQYGVDRRVPGKGKGKGQGKNKIEFLTGRMIVSGSPSDAGWNAKIRALIQEKHPGWGVSGWAEFDDRGAEYHMIAAFELGYKSCEQGLSLQAALGILKAHFKKDTGQDIQL